MHSSSTVRERFVAGSRAGSVQSSAFVRVVRHLARSAHALASSTAQFSRAAIWSVRSSRKPAPGRLMTRRLSDRCEPNVAASFNESRGKFGISVRESRLLPLLASLPNHSLVPTPVTKARFVWLGSGAAHLNRYALQS
jgi:hypothetical protein